MKTKKVCVVCKSEFIPIRKTTKFCSLSCFNVDRVKWKNDIILTPNFGEHIIILTQNKHAVIDEADKHLDKFNWVAIKTKTKFYAVRYEGKKRIYLHQEIMNFPDSFIDHKNGDSLDNRRLNLVISNPKNNMRNIKKLNGCLSNYKGVQPNGSGFVVRITRNYKIFYVGTFKNEVEAARAYDNKIRELDVGNLIFVNFPVAGEYSVLVNQ